MLPHSIAGILAVALVATAMPAGMALELSTAAPERYVVGFAPDAVADFAATVAALGGTILSSSDTAGIAVVSLTPTASTLLASDPVAQFVEPDGPASAAGTEWDGTEWDKGTEWDGTEWDGTEWDGTEWDGTEWDGTEWDGTEWDGTEWDGTEWDWADGRDPGLDAQRALARIGTADAWQVSFGTRSSQLCVVDSGADLDHPDIQANLWTDPATGAHGWNAIDDSTNVWDDGGHGTHVAGIAGGVIGNAWGMAGVGNVQLMIVKALDSTGGGYEGDVALGVAWCADHGADVILLSLTTQHLGSGLNRALKYATDADALVVSSAGNTGGAVTNPATSPFVMAVSALDGTEAIAGFSSRGPAVELSAPGVHIMGPFPDDGFAFGTGTSQSAAFVAGAAALVRDVDPSLTGAETRALLHSTAEDLGPTGRDPEYGHGILDVGAAVEAAAAGRT